EALAQRRAAGMYDSSRMPGERHRRTRFEWLHPTVARYCQERGIPYPPLDDEGNLLEDPRRG
ncbi:MAG: hypothetical protein P8008_06090, partial [Gammaproteobacteria bacterium]